MICSIILSDKFLKDLEKYNLREHSDFCELFIKLIKDKLVYFVGNKNNLRIKQNNLNGQIIYFLKQKIQWIDSDKVDHASADFNFISESEITNTKNVSFSINLIDKITSSKIVKEVDKAKYQMFNIKLTKKQDRYNYNLDELNLFKRKIFKILNVSSKILIWDQYIPDSIAKINKKDYNKKLEKNRYYNDYCNTLKYLDDNIFSSMKKKIFCEILTMNKLEDDWDFSKSIREFISLIQNYINSLKETKGNIKIKNYDPDYWDIIHSRLLVFKDDIDQLINYCVLEPGMDFIKKDRKIKYGRAFRDRKYKFTPGTEVNLSEMDSDLKKISGLKGYEIKNVA